jgi:membrane-associated phospholipid phosphatase
VKGEKDFAMQEVLTVPGAGIAEATVRVRFPVSVVRGPEWVIVAFLIYAAVAAMLFPVAPDIRNRVMLLNLGIIAAYGLLIQFGRDKRTLALSVIRDWLPLGLILLAYREMGWFAMPQHSHALEMNWVRWDRLFLRGGAAAAIEAFGPVLPSILEIAYSLVYALAPFSLAVLYLYGRRDRVDRFLFIVGVGVLLCYAQFPFWPSEPPRVVFFGQDIPASDTIFRHFNLWLLGNCGIHTSVFPSAHVGAAFSVAFGMWRALPERKWVSRLLFAMASLIALATVYGRYHYLADAVAGCLMAVIALAVGAMRDNRLSRARPPMFGGGTVDIEHIEWKLRDRRDEYGGLPTAR